jgi:hypothetical protein
MFKSRLTFQMAKRKGERPMHPELDLSGLLASAYRQQRVGEAARDRLLRAVEREARRQQGGAGWLLRRLRPAQGEQAAARRQLREAVS